MQRARTALFIIVASWQHVGTHHAIWRRNAEPDTKRKGLANSTAVKTAMIMIILITR